MISSPETQNSIRHCRERDPRSDESCFLLIAVLPAKLQHERSRFAIPNDSDVAEKRPSDDKSTNKTLTNREVSRGRDLSYDIAIALIYFTFEQRVQGAVVSSTRTSCTYEKRRMDQVAISFRRSSSSSSPILNNLKQSIDENV